MLSFLIIYCVTIPRNFPTLYQCIKQQIMSFKCMDLNKLLSLVTFEHFWCKRTRRPHYLDSSKAWISLKYLIIFIESFCQIHQMLQTTKLKVWTPFGNKPAVNQHKCFWFRVVKFILDNEKAFWLSKCNSRLYWTPTNACWLLVVEGLNTRIQLTFSGKPL